MVIIDVRKLIGFGRGSYILSVPKDWVMKNKLKKGDLISLNDEGSSLTIAPNEREFKSKLKEISIDTKEKNLEMIKTEIVSAYLNCYDIINIIFDSELNEIQEIKKIIRNLSGLEIMEQTSKRIMAKNLININEISIKNIIRRMDIITRAMIEDTISCYKGNKIHESLLQRDIDVNRLYFLSCRVIRNAIKNPRIAKSLETDAWELHCFEDIVTKLEKIADRQKRIARFVNSSDLSRNTIVELEKIHTDISESFRKVMKAFYNQDVKLALEIEVNNNKITKPTNKLLKKISKNVDTGLVRIVENLNATSIQVRNLARTVLSLN